MKIITATILLFTAFNVTAANAPDKESMHTKAGLYVDSVEAHQMITKPEAREVVLIDVRDGVEIKFTGYTTMTDIHVPWKIIDTTKWDDKNRVMAAAAIKTSATNYKHNWIKWASVKMHT